MPRDFHASPTKREELGREWTQFTDSAQEYIEEMIRILKEAWENFKVSWHRFKRRVIVWKAGVIDDYNNWRIRVHDWWDSVPKPSAKGLLRVYGIIGILFWIGVWIWRMTLYP